MRSGRRAAHVQRKGVVMNKTEKRAIEKAVGDLVWLQEWLNDESVVIGRKFTSSNSLMYTNRNGENVHPINKEIGSPLVAVKRSIRLLRALIE